MGRLRLSLALRTNPRVQALVDNSQAVEGVELTTSLLAPADTFWRQLKFGEFDISEMSLSSLLRAIANGDTTWQALPVFPDRRFFHAWMVVRKDSDIGEPADLRGKRIGVPDYSQTAALWGRGVLQHDFGIAPGDVTWVQERVPELSHGGATGFQAPPGVKIEFMSPGESQRSMFADGRLDASILFITYTTLLDRSQGELSEANVRPLFPDADAEKARAYGKWGFLPFNHCMVVRRELVDEHPWLPLNLYTAFLAAKEKNRSDILLASQPHREAGAVGAGVNGDLTTDLFPYGVKANQTALDTLVDFSHEQGLTPRRIGLDELFAPSVMDL